MFSPHTGGTRALSALGGLACAGLILGALSLSLPTEGETPESEIHVARLAAFPIDVPPPPSTSTPVVAVPLASPIQLEIAASASAVRLRVPEVPLLAVDAPPPLARPSVMARFDLARSAVRPVQEDADLESRRVFDRRDVDQRPMVLQRVNPAINYTKVRNMDTPRVTVLLVVNIDGTVGDVRVMNSSQDQEFDETIMATIREWRFSPAVRKGRKVRCWVEQAISVRVTGGSVFEAH
jgi:protein TonB